MAETKPTKVGRWATDANRTLEPAAGEKDVGWELAKKAPARFMNWLLWVAYGWHNWLNERMFDGVAAKDLEVTGVDVVTGTDQNGGDLTLSGGSATGDGGSEILFLVVPTGQGAGAVVRTPVLAGGFEPTMALILQHLVEATAKAGSGSDAVTGTGDGAGAGVVGTGGATDGAGGQFFGGATDGDGVQATADGDGIGVDATGGDTSGIGMQATGGAPNGDGAVLSGTGTGASGIFNEYLEGIETGDPAAPAANRGRIYFKDVGGKTALFVRFPTGAVQQIAIEP